MARALSLGNFQGITSDSIPLSCQLAYAAEIPTCTVTDFSNSGCTAGCVSGLQSVASNVQSACDSVEVSSVTLLGTILNGGIIQALCPTLAETTQPPQATIVTIPTDSRGVTGGLGFKTTSTTQEHQTTQQPHTTQQPPKQTTTLTTSSSRSISTSTSTSESTTSTISDDTFLTTIFPTTTTQSANGGPAVTTTSTSSQSSSVTKAASTPKPDKGSGGGSPFDISSNGGPNRLQGSFFGAAIALMVCTLILR